MIPFGFLAYGATINIPKTNKKRTRQLDSSQLKQAQKSLKVFKRL